MDNTAFIEALLDEASLRKDYLKGEPVSTIYLGGGTPSVFSVNDLGRILNHISSLFTISSDCEITIELNPDDVTPVYIAELKKTGINRVSLGIQSWNDRDLIFLNRRHDSAQAASALPSPVYSLADAPDITLDLRALP
jgi:oxygen-independent coproporphyrinogen-3 oxidase